MPYVGPATGQVIPRRNRAGTKSSVASSSSSATASLLPASVTSPAKAELALPTDATAAADNADLLTPRPTSIAPTTTIDTLAANLAAAANISDKPDRTSTEEKEKGLDAEGSEVRTTVKEAGLAPSESSASLTSMSTQSEIGTPPTSSTTPDLIADVEARGLGEDAEDGVASRVNRYREGLYAYTRNLYLEAKLSQSQKEGKAAYAQFGLKQSGMERLAAKKALARRLNA